MSASKSRRAADVATLGVLIALWGLTWLRTGHLRAPNAPARLQKPSRPRRPVRWPRVHVPRLALRARPAQEPQPARPRRRSVVWARWATRGVLAMVALAWLVFLRPQALGGPAIYMIVRGDSMQPTYDFGDLLLITAQPAYAVGDPVAYHVPAGELGAGMLVVHRIAGVAPEGGYMMRGDNNPADDPWRPGSELIAGKVVFNYGAVVSWRRQSEEVPSYYLLGIAGGDRTYADSEWVSRKVDMILSDAWLRLNVQRLRVELEFAYVWGRAGNTSMIPGVEIPELSMNQWGLVGQVEWQPSADVPLTVQAETGVASGDSAWGFGAYPSTNRVKGVAGDLDAPQYALPGDTSVNNFRFHPNYHIDKILWRRIIGTFTDGAYVKARLRYEPMKELRADLSAIYSRTLNAESAPGLAKPLGVEVDAELTWFPGWGVEMSAAYAVLFPLAGFRNVYLGVDPKPAQLAEVAPDGKTVWTLTAADLPAELNIASFCESTRLANGNTIIACASRAAKPGPRVFLLEVSPDKKVVWKLMEPSRTRETTAFKLLPAP